MFSSIKIERLDLGFYVETTFNNETRRIAFDSVDALKYYLTKLLTAGEKTCQSLKTE